MTTVGGDLWCGVLGPVEARAAAWGPELLALGPKQRALLALLTVAGSTVSAVDLVTGVWGDDAGDRAAHALQQQVSSVRKLVEPPRTDGDVPRVLRTVPGGYLLEADSDLSSFRSLRREGDLAKRLGRPSGAADAYAGALEVWRGAALADVRASSDRLERLAAALDEERLACTDAWARAWLDVDAAAVVGDLERLVAEHPWREGLRASLMLALYRTGRQADALAVYGEGRRVLAEELGLDPGPELRSLEQAILRHDPALGPEAGAPAAAAPSGEVELFETVRAGSEAQLALALPDGQVVVLDAEVPLGRILIGRVPEAAVRLVDSRVSRRHAEVALGAAGWVVADLGSTNGTRVNGSDPAGHPLVAGDVVDVGGVVLEVVAGSRS